MLCYKMEKNKNKLIIKAVRRKLSNDNGSGRKKNQDESRHNETVRKSTQIRTRVLKR